MTTHPLTEARAAELWEAHIPERKTHYLGWRTFPEPSRRCFTAILRAAFDAGREHEREHADPRHDPRPWEDCTREDIRKGDLVETQYGAITLRIGVACRQSETGDWWTEGNYPLTWGDRWHLRRIPAPTTKRETTMTEPTARTVFGVPDTHGTPHHDVDAIRIGDFVVEVDIDGTTRSGVVSERDCDGDWYDERGDLLVWADSRADHPDAVTVWTAPTPPAVEDEVALPTEFGAVITDVEVDFEEIVRLDSMVWTGLRWTYKDYSTITKLILAFTLPDGTRAIRDGQYEDGAPRFIKETTQ